MNDKRFILMVIFQKLIVTLLIVNIVSSLSAQSDWFINYSFEDYQGTYTEISGGTVHASGTGIDEQVYNNISLPFTFGYNGLGYDQIALHPNGFLVFGGPIQSGYHFHPISGDFDVSPDNLISVFGLDLVSTGSNSELRSGVSGTSPNRIFTVQWSGFAYWAAIGEDEYNFQIKLFETTNDIELVYGEVVSTSIWTTDPEIGLRGESNQQFNNRQTDIDWTNTEVGTENNAKCELSSTVSPPVGLVFKFIYNEAAQFDAGVIEINSPVGPFTIGGEHDIEVTILNYGLEELTSATIAWQVSGSNTEYFSWTGGPIQMGETNGPITVGSFDFQSPGGTIKAWTELPNGQPDENPSNDTTLRNVFVNPYCADPMDCEWIELGDFTLASLHHQDSDCSYTQGILAYGNYTLDPTLSTELFRGSFYTWTAMTLTWANLGIWIDFNNDHEFTHNECIYVSEVPFETAYPEDDFVLSDTVSLGTFRMRVRITMSSEPQLTAYDACTDYWEGETHDYTVSIADVTAPPDCAINPSPENGASGIQLNPVLTCNALGATSYDVYFGTESPPAFVLNQNEPVYLPGILEANTIFYWQLVPRNSFGSATGCEIWQFTTSEDLSYCTDLYFDGCYDWGDEIGDFILADIEHLNSGCTGNGYGYFPEFETGLVWDGNYTWYAHVPSWEYLGMWIDYTKDGDFDDEGEFVYENPEPTVYGTGINVWGDFTLPSDLTLGEYRLRIRLVANESLEADEPCEKFTWGETQDYLITVVEPTAAPVCVESPVPANGATDISINDGILYWEGNGASSYDLYFGISYLELVGNQDSASYNPGLLMPNTTYQWKVIPKNILGEPEDCEVWSFTTSNELEYCEDGLYSSMEFYNCEFGDEIDDFVLEDINHFGSGCSWVGYGNFTDDQSLQTDLVRGGEYPWTATIGLDYQDWMIIWVDFNKDGVFDDGYECVFQSDNLIPTSMSGYVTIPDDAPLGSTRMRVRIVSQEQQLQCDKSCGYFLFGEIHDYTVNITDPNALPECSHSPDPGNGAANVPVLDVMLSWAGIYNATSYDVYFGTSSLEFIGNQTENTFNPGEMEELTTYQWKIVPVKNNGQAEDCEIWSFTTDIYQNVPGIVVPGQITFYPNPTSGVLYLTGYFGSVELKISDITGKLIFTSDYVPSQIDLSCHTKGMYFIKIITEKRIYSEKLIIK